MNVKLFEENSVLKLERSMNDWTDKQNVEVIQIKYSSFGYRPIILGLREIVETEIEI